MSQAGIFPEGTSVADLESLTGSAGGAVFGDSSQNINIVQGIGITVTGDPATHKLTIAAAGGGFTWTEVVGVSQTMVSNNGYIANNVALVTLTLPAAAAVGDVLQIVGKGAGLYVINQNAGQTLHYGNQDTTGGVGGSATATHRYNCIEIICITANTDWVVQDSVGNFTIA